MEFYGMTGERLGTIGQRDEPAPADEPLPEWKKSFMPTWSASVRKGIAKNYDTPYEDTSTLVLTSLSGRFVDIRFPLPSAPASSTATTKEAGSQPSNLISTQSSFWAFTGTVKISFLEPSNSAAHEDGNRLSSPSLSAKVRSDAVTMPYSCHAVFEHEIDSKGPGIIDEGDMFLLPNGDSMEVGCWTDPVSGKWEMYKEYWTEASVPGPPQSSTATVRSSLLNNCWQTHADLVKLSKTPCVVVETVGSQGVKGLVVMIGDYCQGILQRGEEDSRVEQVVVERWERWRVTSASGQLSEEWMRDPRSSAEMGELPCETVVGNVEQYKLGATIESDARNRWTWSVIEILT